MGGKFEEMMYGGIYEEIGSEAAMGVVRTGKMVSSSFVVWEEEGEDLKGILFVYFIMKRKHWKKGTVNMENLPEFAIELHKGDTLKTSVMYFDLKGEYRNFYFRPEMRDLFMVRYE